MNGKGEMRRKQVPDAYGGSHGTSMKVTESLVLRTIVYLVSTDSRMPPS